MHFAFSVTASIPGANQKDAAFPFRRLSSRSVVDCGSPLPLSIRTPLPVDSARGLTQSTTLRAPV